MAKPRITLTTPYESPGTQFSDAKKYRRNSNDITLNGATNRGGIGSHRRFSTNISLCPSATVKMAALNKTAKYAGCWTHIRLPFLPERDYLTFGSLLSQFRLSSVVCLSSVTLVHPTQWLKLSAIFLHRCVRWPSCDLHAKFYGDRPRGTPPPGALNARGVSK